MSLKRKLTTLAATLLLTAQCSQPKSGEESNVKAVPQDPNMKIYKVVLPNDYFEFDKSFNTYVPFIESTKENTNEAYGYWVLCNKPEEEESVIKALGFDYEKYKTSTVAIKSLKDYDPATREAKIAEYCRAGASITDRIWCKFYSLAPERQAPIVCPSALASISNGYTFAVKNAGNKSYGVVSYGFGDYPAFEIGCSELKNALLQPGNPNISEFTIPQTSLPGERTDLSCVNGTSTAPISFESICEDARAGKAPADLYTLNTLIVKMNLNTQSTCAEIKTSINSVFAKGDETSKSLDLSNAGLTSLRLFAYLPALSNVKTLDLSKNAELGADDSTTKSAVTSLSSFIGLAKLDIRGTKVANLSPLGTLQFLDDTGVRADWPQIIPETCKTNSTSQSLRTTCQQLQKAVTVNVEGGTTRYVATAAEIDFKLSASHDLAPAEKYAFELSIDTGKTTCEDLVINGLRVTGKKVPEKSCVISLNAKVKDGRLNAGAVDINVMQFGTCDGHAVDKEWNETFTDRTVTFLCQRKGTGVERVIKHGTCASTEADFVKDQETGSCSAKRCAGNHALDSEWPVEMGDKLGGHTMRCVMQGTTPTPVFQGGFCYNTNQYDFNLATKTCVLVRCENGKKIDETWSIDSTTLPNAIQGYICNSKGQVEPTDFTCKKDYLKRGSQCLLACDSANNHAIGDPAWPANNGTFICEGSKVVLKTCDDKFLPRNNECKLKCDATHAVGDPTWSDGVSTFRCEGPAPTAVVQDCARGWIKYQGVCAKSCDDIHLPKDGKFEVSRDDRKIYYGTCETNGSKTSSWACMPGLDSTDGVQCYRRCDGNVHGKDWFGGSVRHGSIKSVCSDGNTVNTINCEPGFTQVGNGCYRDCGSGHIEGTATATWVDTFSDERFRYTCTESGTARGESLGCRSGYSMVNGQCRKDAPAPECTPNGAKKCTNKVVYRCNFGKWERTGSLCDKVPF